MDIDTTSTVLVTGANGGIGQAIARAIARRGARVIVSGRRADALAGIAAEIGARVIVADLSKREDTARLVDEAGDVDVLVANAALPASGPLSDFTEEQTDRALEVNLRAPIELTRRLTPGMVARRRGHVVFISSIAGKLAGHGSALYSATKFGLRGFALGVRADLSESGVGVTGIFPGFIRDAGMFADAGVALPTGLGSRTSEDVAHAVLAAVRDNPAEIDVAAFEQRFAGVLASVSPALFAKMGAALGAAELGYALGEGQRHKR